MITIPQAFERIRELSEAEVRELTTNRLLGDDVAPVGSSYFDEPPEDLVIQLLRNRELSPKTRHAVIEGCKQVYVQLQPALLGLGKATARNWEEVAFRFCGTLDVASPPELKGLAYALLDLILYSSPDVSTAFLPPAVRAAMGYDQTPDRIPAWETILKNHPPVAAYAFSALLAIVPRSQEIERYLKLLWERQIRSDWPVDTAFLMRRASRKHGKDVIRRLLRWLQKQPYANKAVAELKRREWSRNWLEQLFDDSLRRLIQLHENTRRSPLTYRPQNLFPTGPKSGGKKVGEPSLAASNLVAKTIEIESVVILEFFEASLSKRSFLPYSLYQGIEAALRTYQKEQLPQQSEPAPSGSRRIYETYTHSPVATNRISPRAFIHKNRFKNVVASENWSHNRLSR